MTSVLYMRIFLSELCALEKTMGKVAKRPAVPPHENRPARKPAKRPTNLTLDAEAVAGGERYGKQHGTSLSQLVNSFLHALVARASEEDITDLAASLTPPVRRLYGLAAGGTTDRDAHRAHLLEKYGSRR